MRKTAEPAGSSPLWHRQNVLTRYWGSLWAAQPCVKEVKRCWQYLAGYVYEYANDLGYGEGVGHEVHPVGGRVGVAQVGQREGEGGGQQEHLAPVLRHTQ